MIKAPIWKDTVYQITGDTLSYYVKVGDVTVWDDVAHRRPNDTRIKIYMNRIAIDFMEGNLAFVTGLTENPKEFVEFKLYAHAGGIGRLLETYQFLFSFDGEWNGETKVLSNPINGIIDLRMLAPITVYSGGTGGGDTGETSWYLIFDTNSYTVPADVEEGTEYSFYVTDTNLPYSGSTSGKLTGGDYVPAVMATGSFYGLGTYLDMFVQYEHEGILHSLYDTTNVDGRIYFKLKPNNTGEERTYQCKFWIPATGQELKTITITQLG